MEFKDKYDFLSNFYPCSIGIEGIVYPSAEHAYQAMKTDNQAIRTKISTLEHPAQAKKYGKTIRLRKDWNKFKVFYMYDILCLKFMGIPDLSDKLVGVNDIIMEENWWGDKYWGVCLKTGEGKNILGTMLTHIRRILE